MLVIRFYSVNNIKSFFSEKHFILFCIKHAVFFAVRLFLCVFGKPDIGEFYENFNVWLGLGIFFEKNELFSLISFQSQSQKK